MISGLKWIVLVVGIWMLRKCLAAKVITNLQNQLDLLNYSVIFIGDLLRSQDDWCYDHPKKNLDVLKPFSRKALLLVFCLVSFISFFSVISDLFRSVVMLHMTDCLYHFWCTFTILHNLVLPLCYVRTKLLLYT